MFSGVMEDQPGAGIATRLTKPGTDRESRKPANLPLLALCFLAGSCFLHLQPTLSGPAWTSGSLLGLLPLFLLLLWLKPPWRPLLCFMLGYLWSLLFALSYLTQVLDDSASGRDYLVRGYIAGIPDASDGSVRFNFRVKQIIQPEGQENQSSMQGVRNLRLSWYYFPQAVTSGDEWQLLVRLKAPHGMQNPGGFDYEKWLYTSDIHATGYVRKGKHNHLLRASTNSVNGLRQSLQQTIYSLPESTYQGIIEALTIGNRSKINSEQWQLLLDTGTSHLMAISGLHIGLVAGLVFWGARKLVPVVLLNYYSDQQYAAVFSLLAAGFYASLAGFSVPTQRAFVMLLVMLLALIARRPAFGLNTLSLALIAVIIINPVSVISAGFWLSFLAVLIIAVLVMGRQLQPSRLKQFISGLRVQWMIALGMLPLTLLLFQQASIISPIANILVIPLVGFVVVPLSLIASLISFISPALAMLVFSLATEAVSLVWQILQLLASIPGASWYIPGSSSVHALLALGGGALLLLPAGFPMRYAGLICILPLLLSRPERPADGDVWVNVLDVGQGLAILLQTSQHNLLYDTGDKFSERFDIGQRVVLPFLRYKGVKQLDILMISHADRDHSGGAPAILQNVAVHQLLGDISRVEVETLPQQYKSCSSGDKWHWDGVSFEVLHPDGEYKRSNNRSCVLRVSTPGFSLIIPGDIEGKVERRLLSRYQGELTADVLVLAHHGSNTSTTSAWIKQLQPRLAIVSAGYRNRFGHPAGKVQQRLHKHSIPMLNTADTGAINIQAGSKPEMRIMKLRTRRKDAVHYWNHRF